MFEEKEKRDKNIKVRLSQSEKEVVEKYCEEHNMNLSIFVRNALVTEMRRLDGKKVN